MDEEKKEPQTTKNNLTEEDWRLDNPRSWYFDNSKMFFKILRFLNLLELGKPVISWSKMMLFLSFILVLVATGDFILAGDATRIEGLLGSIGVFSMSLANYGFRRVISYYRFVRGENVND